MRLRLLQQRRQAEDFADALEAHGPQLTQAMADALRQELLKVAGSACHPALLARFYAPLRAAWGEGIENLRRFHAAGENEADDRAAS